MNEYSRIVIEEYCTQHKSAKSKKLNELVELSYDIDAFTSDEDAVFLERTINREKNPELKKALIDLDHFLFRS